MKVFISLGVVLVSLNLIQALPTALLNEKSLETKNYATQASRVVAVNLLKSYNDIDGNQVHSPLGVTTMLAILAEAAQGKTYDEFSKVLGYPSKRSDLRLSFQQLLKSFQTRAYGYEPSFQTWLYIYRNFTANDEFKQLMRDHYYVIVKGINYNDYDWSVPNTALDLDSITSTSTSASTSTSNSKDVIGFETLKRFKLHDDDGSDNNDDNKEDDDGNKPDLITTASTTITDNYGKEFVEKEPTKFDRNIDDKQYVETTQIIKEELHEPLKQELPEKLIELDKRIDKVSVENLDEKPVTPATVTAAADSFMVCKHLTKTQDELNLEENETIQEKEKFVNKNQHKQSEEFNDLSQKFKAPLKKESPSNEPEKVSLPLEKLAEVLDDATMNKASSEEVLILKDHITTARNAFSGRKLFRKDDITSALSANSMTGRDKNSKTKMLLFNGLYFRGTWATPFFEQNTKNDEFFYMTAEDALKVSMMHSMGKFHLAELTHLNSKVLCLPYESTKYAMFIFLPNDLEGLHKLIENLQTSDLTLAKEKMLEQDLHVVLPKFQFEETSRSESMLKSLGLTRIFSRSEADLGLLSQDADLHVDEIVQFVNIRVDETGSSEAGLSALDTQSRNAETKYQLIEMNHPFVYFIVNQENDFVLVSGKVHVPELPYDLPVSIEVEFDKS